MRRSAARNVSVLAVVAAVGLDRRGRAARPLAPPAARPPKTPVAAGYGGAVASVDADASAAGIEVLRRGGNAVDAAVATAAALGVTEPYSAGIGGGGYFVYYDAKSRTVHTIDGRETAPRSADASLFLENGKPIPFEEGHDQRPRRRHPRHPGDLGQRARRLGQQAAAAAAEAGRAAGAATASPSTPPSARRPQANQARFADFPDTAKLFLPGGQLPVVGSVFKNPDLARTYKELGRKGVGALYRGELAEDIVRRCASHPWPRARRAVVRPGDLTAQGPAVVRDGAAGARPRSATAGLDVYGMAPSSSGGTSVGEALNILERTDLSKATAGAVSAPLHRGEPDRVRGPGALGRRPGLRGRADARSCCRSGSRTRAAA